MVNHPAYSICVLRGYTKHLQKSQKYNCSNAWFFNGAKFRYCCCGCYCCSGPTCPPYWLCRFINHGFALGKWLGPLCADACHWTLRHSIFFTDSIHSQSNRHLLPCHCIVHPTSKHALVISCSLSQSSSTSDSLWKRLSMIAKACQGDVCACNATNLATAFVLAFNSRLCALAETISPATTDKQATTWRIKIGVIWTSNYMNILRVGLE